MDHERQQEKNYEVCIHAFYFGQLSSRANCCKGPTFVKIKSQDLSFWIFLAKRGVGPDGVRVSFHCEKTLTLPAYSAEHFPKSPFLYESPNGAGYGHFIVFDYSYDGSCGEQPSESSHHPRRTLFTGNGGSGNRFDPVD